MSAFFGLIYRAIIKWDKIIPKNIHHHGENQLCKNGRRKPFKYLKPTTWDSVAHNGMNSTDQLIRPC